MIPSFGHTLFCVFAHALKVDDIVFLNITLKPTSNLRLLRYHARDITPGEKALGIGVHTDSECFTILSPPAAEGFRWWGATGAG